MVETRVIGLVRGERERGRDLRCVPGTQRRQTPSIKSTGFVVEIGRYFVVGDLLKVVKTRVFLVSFEDRGGNVVSRCGFLFGRRAFRGAFGAFEAANDPGWQNARWGIHRRWYNGDGRRGG
jgi:hypothetical protein